MQWGQDLWPQGQCSHVWQLLFWAVPPGPSVVSPHHPSPAKNLEEASLAVGLLPVDTVIELFRARCVAEAAPILKKSSLALTAKCSMFHPAQILRATSAVIKSKLTASEKQVQDLI